jgi:small subunit ribosomal protein S2
MLPYIYGQRNNVHIINLDETYKHWLKSRKFVHDIVSRGGSVLFVGTKLQARPLVEVAAKRSGSFFITNRWLGGALSNFQTLKNSMRRMKNLEDLLAQAALPDTKIKISKKERLSISRQVEKLQHNLGGIREMRKLPEVIFVLDVNKESIAVAEARKLQIPVVALVDTNVDPNKVDMPIPTNDDAYKAIKLFVDGMAEAIIDAKRVFRNRMQEQAVVNAKASGVRGNKHQKQGSNKKRGETVSEETPQMQ